jgi:hypothetical protein
VVADLKVSSYLQVCRTFRRSSSEEGMSADIPGGISPQSNIARCQEPTRQSRRDMLTHDSSNDLSSADIAAVAG